MTKLSIQSAIDSIFIPYVSFTVSKAEKYGFIVKAVYEPNDPFADSKKAVSFSREVSESFLKIIIGSGCDFITPVKAVQSTNKDTGNMRIVFSCQAA